ncbi:MAG: HEAT repeat domain-containing protein [Phycisphaerae bacterium]|nr:HEAT repeat domain-containing protein [Phycisphaerae bacterium]
MTNVTKKFARLKLAARLVICLLPAMTGCEPQPLEANRQAGAELAGGPMPLREARQLVSRSMKNWPACTTDKDIEIHDAFTDTMIRLLAHRDPARRAEAAAALGEFRKPQAIDALLLGAREDNRTVRVASIKALGWIGDKRCALAVANRLDDPAVDVRIAAADTLGRLKNPVTVNALITACKDPAPRVRASAAGALGWIRDKRATKALIAATDDKTPRVRAAAVGALGLLKDPAALAALIVAGTDSSPLVRAAAVGALGQLTDPLAKDALRRLAKDSDPAVRRAAKSALTRVKR